MPTRNASYWHDSLVSPGSPPAVGTSFDLADVHIHDLASTLPAFAQGGNFASKVTGIHIRMGSLSGGAAKVTIRVCLDAAGDIVLIPDTEAELAKGLTTTDSGCAAFAIGIPLFQILGGFKLYLFAHVDQGTATMLASCITWQE